MDITGEVQVRTTICPFTTGKLNMLYAEDENMLK
jgi:ATP-dependent RNA circularization protein (DNA/RNA ligase family)